MRFRWKDLWPEFTVGEWLIVLGFAAFMGAVQFVFVWSLT